MLLKNSDEVLVYPKTVAQAVTVMQAGYSDGSTTQTLAERLAALEETDSALSSSISSLEETLSETEDSLLGQFDALEDINTVIGTVESLQEELSTTLVTSIANKTTASDTFYITTAPLATTPVAVSDVTLAEAVRTLAAYCHSHSVGDSTTNSISTSCSSYCDCDNH